MSASDPASRRGSLAAAGASGAVLEELLAYDVPLFGSEPGEAASQPPPSDEPHLAAWSVYAEEARAEGAIPALSRRFPQLLYPIRAGISATDGYRRATRQGIWPEGDPEASGLPLSAPDRITLEIHPTLAGRLPLIIAGERSDFEDLVRAFSARNEPVDVPASMGACIVTGFNNWDRIREYRRLWEAANPFGDWQAEFSTVIPRKELYEDRFIILSSGPYSGVPAEAAGYAQDRWRDLSLQIRRDHECTHYFTFRLAGAMRNNLLDEIIADYVGLVRTFGSYRLELALLFFGLEDFPRYREGARLQNYRGSPPLSADAFALVRGLVHRAAQNLAALDAARAEKLPGDDGLRRLVVVLASLPLSDLAAAGLGERLVPAAAAPDGPGRASDGALQVHLSSGQDPVEEAVERFAAFASRRWLPKRLQTDVFIVLDEIVSNIARCAWEDGQDHAFEMTACVREGVLELEFIDSGKAFDPLARQEPDVDRSLEERPIGGLGIHIVKKLTDVQRYERRDGKNRLLLCKRI
ncbi:MAG TPA: ATP-binding protein [Thermoanaerobaculia bacterium]|nr:ATP-binding protein [Thermoanaerobaculia bacterium]